jgi:hypothetical protein
MFGFGKTKEIIRETNRIVKEIKIIHSKPKYKYPKILPNPVCYRCEHRLSYHDSKCDYAGCNCQCFASTNLEVLLQDRTLENTA